MTVKQKLRLINAGETRRYRLDTIGGPIILRDKFAAKALLFPSWNEVAEAAKLMLRGMPEELRVKVLADWEEGQ